jgi:predicted permease
MFRDLLFRLRATFRRGVVDNELEDELRFHLEHQIEKNIRSGMSPEEAQRQARLSFGGLQRVTEQCRAAWGTRLWTAFTQDLRYGLRMMMKDRGFTFIATLILALGIGANTAMFSVLNAVLLRPSPYHDASRIVALQQSNPAIAGLEVTGVSPLEYLDYVARTHAFSAVGGVILDSTNLTGGSEPVRVKTGRITPSIFDVLGVEPMFGRRFRPEEDQYGGPAVVILSHGLWRQQFGADRKIVGSIIHLDKKPYTVVGVMPSSFKFPYDGTPYYEPAAAWVPMQFTPGDMQNRTDGYDVQAFARLKNGVTLAQAQQDADAARRSFQADHRDVYNAKFQPVSRVEPMKQMAVSTVRPVVLVLSGAVLFVLLITCANVANLLLVRSTARTREIAVRSALGASSLRVARQLITESVLLAMLGGTLGLSVAYVAIRVIAQIGSAELPRLSEVSIDVPVLLFTLGASVVTGIMFGLAPVFGALHIDLRTAISAGSHQSGSARGSLRWNNVLVVFETGAAMVILVSAGLLINSFIRVLRVPPGFDPRNVLIVRTAFDPATYPTPAARNAAKKRLLQQFAALPGVTKVGATTQLPLADERNIGVHVDGEDQDEFHMIANELVTPTYFDAMGISLQRGRSFSDQDRPDRPFVAVVSDSMAQKFWPDQDPIGKHLTWGGRWAFVVVGVVADIRLSALDAPPAPTIYMSMLQTEGGRSTSAAFAIRAASDPRGLIEQARHAVWSVDANLPVFDVATMNDVMSESLARRRFSTVLLGIFAGIALLLAAAGLYGVLSYSVAQRSHEMGLRIALGATPHAVRGLVLRAGLEVVSMGILVGVLGALATTRLMSNMLYGITVVDPATYAGVATLFVVTAMLACYAPARRATKVDPMAALRQE